MVEFAFDLKQLFPQAIIRVQPHHLRPADPRCKLSKILDSLGELSAWAQGLRKPVTVADKLAGDQMVYLISDKDSGHLAVTGLLKIGTKNLFLYDERDNIRHCDRTPAILDFYIHETRQRRGQGKRLFERMLADQGWKAYQCSVDRPSPKMKAFLGKHYGLVRTIPQVNHFVLYEGFFDDQVVVPVPALSGRGRAVVANPSRPCGASQSSLQLSSQHKDTIHGQEPGYKQGNGRGQNQNKISKKFQSFPKRTATVADLLGVGERISNRSPEKHYAYSKIHQ